VVAHLEIDAFDPVRVFGEMKGPERFLWFQPDRAMALVAEGVTLCLETAGEGRIRDAGARLAEEEARFFYVDPKSRERLRWLGGFSFDARHQSQGEWAGFPAGQLSLPSLLFETSPEGTAVVLTQSISADAQTDSILASFESQMIRAQSLIMEREGEEGFDRSSSQPTQAGESGPEYAVAADRPHSIYCETVKKGVDAIVAGAFEKVVVARSLEVRHPGRYPLDEFLRRLSVIYPSCTVLAWGHEDSTLIAASPEFLVSLEGERVRTHALAGSAARGSSPDQDALFARRLVESKKEQAEHAAVVRAVREALRDVCGELEGPEAPSLLKIEGIQHLATPLQGRLRDQDSIDTVLDLVARLHPTPAVCGLPRQQSLDWLRAHEHLDRGWYAGPVGWVGADGDGEFWLALRAGLIRQPQGDSSEGIARARLYAGAGVVEGSSPESELAETRLKLRALLAPLTEI
jgi:isochorismate synthase